MGQFDPMESDDETLDVVVTGAAPNQPGLDLMHDAPRKLVVLPEPGPLTMVEIRPTTPQGFRGEIWNAVRQNEGIKVGQLIALLASKGIKNSGHLPLANRVYNEVNRLKSAGWLATEEEGKGLVATERRAETKTAKTA